MEQLKFIFEQYDEDKDQLLTKDEFFIFIYELGKQEIVQNQFEDCLKLISDSEFIDFEQLENGILSLYECDFLPDLNKPKINPQDSPNYHLYEKILKQNFEDFYEVEDEDDEDEDDNRPDANKELIPFSVSNDSIVPFDDFTSISVEKLNGNNSYNGTSFLLPNSNSLLDTSIKNEDLSFRNDQAILPIPASPDTLSFLKNADRNSLKGENYYLSSSLNQSKNDNIEDESIFERMKRENNAKKSISTNAPRKISKNSKEWTPDASPKLSLKDEDNKKRFEAKKLKDKNMPDWMKELQTRKQSKASDLNT